MSAELGDGRDFPSTRLSLLAALAHPSEETRREAADALVRGYWGPVVALLGARWHLERTDAEDLTQEFFSEALQGEWLGRFDPEKGRFRTYVRVCADRFASNARKARLRLKRGGSISHESLDAADTVAASGEDDVDAQFNREWVRSVLAQALASLRALGVAAGKEDQVAMFEIYYVDDPPDEERLNYRQLADRFRVPETQVTNYLAWARREYRRCVLDALQKLSANDAEFREDAHDLLGGWPV